MFQRVDAFELLPETKYKIVADKEYTGIYKGECWHNPYLRIFDEVCGRPAYFSTNRTFYQFVSQKARIQSDMERRALDLIFRKLLGDPHFEW
jgi:hypothetical protein